MNEKHRIKFFLQEFKYGAFWKFWKLQDKFLWVTQIDKYSRDPNTRHLKPRYIWIQDYLMSKIWIFILMSKIWMMFVHDYLGDSLNGRLVETGQHGGILVCHLLQDLEILVQTPAREIIYSKYKGIISSLKLISEILFISCIIARIVANTVGVLPLKKKFSPVD